MFKISQRKSLDMTLSEIILLTTACWNENHRTLTIDMTKKKCTGRFCLGLDSLFVPHTNAFQTL